MSCDYAEKNPIRVVSVGMSREPKPIGEKTTNNNNNNKRTTIARYLWRF